jgi:recombinational DNA repair protein RecR
LSEPKVKRGEPFLVEQLVPTENHIEALWEIVEQCHREEISHEERCQFCGDTLRSGRYLMVHLGRHMEKLAMPVLEMINQSFRS